MTIEEDLRTLFTKAKLPSSPALAARILELSDDPDSTIEQFAELIQMDPALAARLLRTANSPLFGQHSEVKTIHRAVSLLGMSRVRTISLGFQLVSHLGRLGDCEFDMRRFWCQSLLRACLAREFAIARVPAGADEAFLVGLLQDCGIVLLAQMYGKPYAELYESGLSPTAFYAAERERFEHDHVRTVGAVAREWKLPASLVRQLELHHDATTLFEDSSDDDWLSAISYLVGSLQLSSAANAGHPDSALAHYAAETLGIDDDCRDGCLAHAASAYTEMARLLEGMVPENLDVTELLSQANIQLTMSIETERHQSAQEREHLCKALGQYRDRAARDPLTAVLNRGALVDAIRERVQACRSDSEPITVVFLDIDNFKLLNDNFGHQAGDQVLKAVAEALRSVVSNAGIVGRYGGEEFVLAVRGLREKEARRLSDRVVACVRNASSAGLDLPDPVTCSLGMVWGVPESGTTAEGLMHAADELMYQAKRAGKDCGRHRRFREAFDMDALESDTESLDACDALRKTGMTRGHAVVSERFVEIAKRLNRETPRRFLGQRKQVRKEWIAPCKLVALTNAAAESVTDDAYVRNISTGGIGILTTRPLVRGQPVEVTITESTEPTLYVAGVVAFCRHVEDTIHEVGIQLFAHAAKPILSKDPVSAIRNLDWVTGSMTSRRPSAPAASGVTW